MKSSVVKRSVVIDGHKTSVGLEDAFLTKLKNIVHARQLTLRNWSGIPRVRAHRAIVLGDRLLVLHHFQDKRKDVAKPQVSAIAAERTPAS